MPIKSLNHPTADFNNQYWRSGPEAASAAPPGSMEATGGNIPVTSGSYKYQ